MSNIRYLESCSKNKTKRNLLEDRTEGIDILTIDLLIKLDYCVVPSITEIRI